MEEQMKQTVDDIRELTEETMVGLVGHWLQMYNEDAVIGNIVKLFGHAKEFFKEITEETTNRKAKFKEDIANLEREHQSLTTMLKCRPLDLLSHVDQPLLYYQHSLDEQLQHMRDQVAERKVRIQQIERRESELCNLLDNTIKGLDCESDCLPSQEELDNFEFYVQELQAQYESRHEEVANLRFQIQTIADEIELDVSRSGLMKHKIKMSSDNIEELRALLEQVRADKSNIKSEIQDKWATLQSLYDCLDTSSTSRIEFSQPLTKTTVTKLNTEIVRCEKIKRQNLKKVIEKVRKQIVEYWELNRLSDKERARFSNFTNDCYTEDLLMLHEMERNDLIQFYNVNAEIFDKYKVHMELWDRAIALEARETDPNRYKNRGGNLLLEEKERRSVAQRLAKLRSELERLASEYEAEKRRPFTIDGHHMIESIDELYASRRLAKEQQMSARKASSTTINRMGPPNSMLVTSAMSAPRNTAGPSSRTPMSNTRLDNRSGMLKRSASTTKIHFPVSASKKPKIIISTPTPSNPLIKRSILSELTASITPNASQAKFRKPAARKPTKVIDTLTINGARRKSANSRRSLNKHANNKPTNSVRNGTSTDNSYVQFEEEMTVRSRSSIKPKVAKAIKARPLTPRRLELPSALNVLTPLTPCRASPRVAKTLQCTVRNTPSPALKRLPEFF